MQIEDLKSAWQATNKVKINGDVLLREVQRNQREFNRAVLWSDVREVGACVVMVPVWFYLGAKWALPWTWYLTVPALLWIGAFLLVDRLRQSSRRPRLESGMGECLQSSLDQVEHQIWLLRNLGWWYLLPPSVTMAAFLIQVAAQAPHPGWVSALFVLGLSAGIALVNAVMYWLNQNSVREEFEPRRQELRKLIEELEQPLQESTKQGPISRRAALWVGLLGVVVAVASVFAYMLGEPDAAPFDPKFCPATGDAAITNLVMPIRQKYRVPAMAAAIVTSRGMTHMGVVGTRKRGTQTAVTVDDLWHLGSDTKAMTATLMARLVEQGRIKWDSTMAEIFPELAARFDAKSRTITVRQLLSHRAGLAANPNLIFYLGSDGRQERLRLVKNTLSDAPKNVPGSKFVYSNLGYCIAGAVIERITGKTWEAAMQKEIFKPLGMTTVGFGGTGTPGKLDQPWGHDTDGHPADGNGPDEDNPPVMSPAGRVHCSMQDWSKFIADQLRGARGEPALLKPESYRMLQTPLKGEEYALGWIVVQREWGGGTVLNHGGDNTLNFANVWVAPKRDFAILVCVNQSADAGFDASDDAVGALVAYWQKHGADRN